MSLPGSGPAPPAGPAGATSTVPTNAAPSASGTASSSGPQLIDSIPVEVARAIFLENGVTGDKINLQLAVLAAQKFVCDILSDCVAQSRSALAAAGGTQRRKDVKLTLTEKDLAEALRERGISYRYAPFFSDTPSAAAAAALAPTTPAAAPVSGKKRKASKPAQPTPKE